MLPACINEPTQRRYQRETVCQLVHALLNSDIARFSPERFKDWIKEISDSFRKAGLTLAFESHNRSARFTIYDTTGGRIVFRFTAPDRLGFDDKELAGAADGIDDKARPPHSVNAGRGRLTPEVGRVGVTLVNTGIHWNRRAGVPNQKYILSFCPLGR